MTMTDDEREFLRLGERIVELSGRDDLTWDERYDAIFSTRLAGALFKLDVKLADYEDPDAGYDDDVMALADAVQATMERVRRVDR